MDSFFLGLASFVLVLVPLVVIHEFGHFIAAKLAGITVLEFGIGFPPRALTLFRRGDTIYTINWLPIGGFVRPLTFFWWLRSISVTSRSADVIPAWASTRKTITSASRIATSAWSLISWMNSAEEMLNGSFPPPLVGSIPPVSMM